MIKMKDTIIKSDKPLPTSAQIGLFLAGALAIRWLKKECLKENKSCELIKQIRLGC